MQIHELDPTKRYLVSIESDHITQEELEALKTRLEEHCAGAVVIANVEMELSDERKYWGLYCPQHDLWLSKTDGMFVQFNAPAIAQAWLDTVIPRSGNLGADHLWEVAEFGKAQFVDYKSLPPRSPLCPA